MPQNSDAVQITSVVCPLIAAAAFATLGRLYVAEIPGHNILTAMVAVVCYGIAAVLTLLAFMNWCKTDCCSGDAPSYRSYTPPPTVPRLPLTNNGAAAPTAECTTLSVWLAPTAGASTAGAPIGLDAV